MNCQATAAAETTFIVEVEPDPIRAIGRARFWWRSASSARCCSLTAMAMIERVSPTWAAYVDRHAQVVVVITGSLAEICTDSHAYLSSAGRGVDRPGDTSASAVRIDSTSPQPRRQASWFDITWRETWRASARSEGYAAASRNARRTPTRVGRRGRGQGARAPPCGEAWLSRTHARDGTATNELTKSINARQPAARSLSPGNGREHSPATASNAFSTSCLTRGSSTPQHDRHHRRLCLTHPQSKSCAPQLLIMVTPSAPTTPPTA